MVVVVVVVVVVTLFLLGDEGGVVKAERKMSACPKYSIKCYNRSSVNLV